MDLAIDVSAIERKGLSRPSSAKALPRIAQIKLVSQHPEVYEPCDDSFALVDALLADRANLLLHKPALCMEIGCGSGYVITSLAIMLGVESSMAHYFATDINPHAVETTRKTLEAHGVHAEIVVADIASGLQKRLKGMMDVVVVNPPYVPTPEEEVGQEGITASWAGGENGRRVIDRILPVADELLSDKGWLYMLTLTANNPSEICRLMRERGYGSRIIVQRSTEEESLHVIKFWRENGSALDRGVFALPDGCIRALAKRASIEPLVTLTVWKELVTQNRGFFQAYYFKHAYKCLQSALRFRRRNCWK